MRIRLMALTVLCTVTLLFMSGMVSAEKLTIWDYVDWRVEYYRQYAAEYMQLNPDVEIEVQLVPLGEYTNKIVVGIVTGTAPNMFAGHPTWVATFDGLLEPFPQDLFPPDRLSEELFGYRQLLQAGHVYYYPLGMQGPILFINEDHWDNAGIAAAPVTWREAVDLGRRTTKVTGGVTEVAGFHFVSEMMTDLFIDLNYQHGGNIYRANGTEVTFDEMPAQEAVNLVSEMYQTGVSGFGETFTFQAGNIAMLYSFAWRHQQISPVQNLRWRVAPIPTLTGELHDRMSRMDYYFGLAVPSGNSVTATREAFKFLDWAYGDDSRLLDLNSRSGTLPARMSVWGQPEIVENKVLRQLTQTLPYAIPPGEYPDWIKTQLNQVRTAITTGAMDPALLLRDLTRQINARLAEEPVTWVAE